MESYFLARHVYPCVTDDHVVLLDLHRDKYVGVGREQMAFLGARVKGWPLLEAAQGDALPASRTVRSSNTGADAVLAKMLATGMLTTDPALGKEARPVEMPQVDAALVADELETQPEVTVTHVVRFFRAWAAVALEMKLRPIEAVLTRMSARKARRQAKTFPLDLAAARSAVGAFIRLRPLVFGAQDACLFDSITLVRYLSYYGIFPACVIGVQTGPFAAHCWVQDGAVLFNDSPEWVRRYTPILVV